MGVIYYNKYTKNTDYYKMIEGTLGREICMKFLLRIVKFVLVSKSISNENLEYKNEIQKYNKIFDDCCLKKVKK